MKIAFSKDKVLAAIERFRIYHRLTDERASEINEDLAALWLQWRIDHDHPLKKDEWELHWECWQAWVESLSVWSDDGHLIGQLQLSGPPSPELAKLLEKRKAA
jgi:hypothetical protein